MTFKQAQKHIEALEQLDTMAQLFVANTLLTNVVDSLFYNVNNGVDRRVIDVLQQQVIDNYKILRFYDYFTKEGKLND